MPNVHTSNWRKLLLAAFLGCGTTNETPAAPSEETTAPEWVCGDGMCASGESCETCPDDCGVCAGTEELDAGLPSEAAGNLFRCNDLCPPGYYPLWEGRENTVCPGFVTYRACTQIQGPRIWTCGACPPGYSLDSGSGSNSNACFPYSAPCCHGAPNHLCVRDVNCGALTNCSGECCRAGSQCTGGRCVGGPMPPTAARGVYLYQDDTFRGSYILISHDCPDLQRHLNHRFGDRASSIRMVGIRRVTIYQHDTYGGRALTLDHNCPDLRRHLGHNFGDIASSVRLQ